MLGANSIWIKQPLACFTAGTDNADGGVVIRDGRIVELLSVNEQPSEPVDEVFDAREHVLLPGLINTHHHFYQTLTRALPCALDKELFDWLKSLYPVWAGLTPDMLYSGTQIALAELLLSGCTTAADHHYLFPTGMEEAIDIQVEAREKIGSRVTLTRGSMSLGEDDGGLPPQTTVQDEQVILRDSERLVNRYHERGDGAFVQIALAPCSPFSVSEELMRDSAALANELDIQLHTHLAETLDEEAFCMERFGCRTVDYLERVGWLQPRTWLAHGIHFNDAEIQRLGAAGVGVAHCPGSNMMLASGICRNLELEAAGVNIGLAVDGSASNDSSNMIVEARMAMYIQRLRYGSAAVSHRDALRWATSGSAAVLGREDIGQIAVGKQADLALFRRDDISFAGSHDPLAALLLCNAQRADRVMIGGHWRVIDGAIPGLDLPRLIARQHEQAAALVARLH
ncbi:8-oxoguanine deaminase [Halioglobus japonicus]|uniref:8-oxoguanine deaminase n=1 Tax=Halioglobus japonicus TaxID=930805 RepID=A0AAP8MDS9_9GAMM|nr:8-oxoguanine deaminase [Halioglobus japonicus]AQA17717.1 8-oxoguanine deaminase [Halioglobus japonicus]PLW85669.1 8-oxoguanine deaminase [Halioglobus japonicus]GHD16848.1 8-oxoguanine deaminase [Halioglobus japonicus]